MIYVENFGKILKQADFCREFNRNGIVIGNFVNLRKLYLTFNRLTSLPNSLVNLEYLSELILRSNQLTSIPETIGNLVNLQIFFKILSKIYRRSNNTIYSKTKSSNTR